MQTDSNPNPRFLRNFLMQGNGAEMLRLACCLISEAGIKLSAPVHDAVLIEAPLDELDNAIERTKSLMAEASALVLDGFRLSCDVDVIRFPDRYSDERGAIMWETVSKILHHLESLPCASTHTLPVHERTVTCAPTHTRSILLSYRES